MITKILLLVVIYSAVLLPAMPNGISTNVTAAETTQTNILQAGDAKLIAQEDAYRELKQLDKKEQLFIPCLNRSMNSGGDLKKENCLGILLANGARILGESRGKDYGFDLRPASLMGVPVPVSMVMMVIGFLYIEGPVQIQGNSTSPGPYVVVATTENKFRLARSVSMDDAVDLSRELTKELGLDVAGFGPKASRPKLNAVLEKGEAYLEVEGNKLRVAAP